MQTHEEMQELANKKLRMLLKIMSQMMNPNSEEKPELMEYDCVQQLKGIVKNYYTRKGKLTEKLLKRLDAIVIERPRCLEQKKEAVNEKAFKLPSLSVQPSSRRISPRNTLDTTLTLTDY